MRKFLLLLACLAMLMVPKEAEVSQLMIQEIDAESLTDYFQNNLSAEDQILVVKGPLKSEVFKEVIFPKATHFQKKEDSMYQEFVFQYQVVAVLQSKQFKVNDLFWVWEEPGYGYEAIKSYHEEGMLESPIVLERKSNYPVKNDEMIVVLADSEQKNTAYPETYTIKLKEGKGALGEITALLHQEQKKWWQFWK